MEPPKNWCCGLMVSSFSFWGNKVFSGEVKPAIRLFVFGGVFFLCHEKPHVPARLASGGEGKGKLPPPAAPSSLRRRRGGHGSHRFAFFVFFFDKSHGDKVKYIILS